jgi:hypothetical protein
MRISSVTIRNFRSFDENGVTLAIPEMKLPLSIIGHNNSGKTNFIKALLYGLAVRSVTNETFTLHDFHLRDASREIQIEIHVDPPLRSADIFNTIKPMPQLRLNATIEQGVSEVRHVCCGPDGKPVFNPKALKRSKTKKISEEDRELLNANLKKGSETVSRVRSQLPVFYIDCSNMEWQLRPTGFTLLGKVLTQIRREFDLDSSVMGTGDGVLESHRGKPRKSIFERALKYLDEHVLPTQSFTSLVSLIERVLKQQLEMESDEFSVHFGAPSPDYFFDNLTFFVTDHSEKPRLPITHMGNGFVALFVVALIRAIVREDEGGNVFIIEEPETFQHEHFQDYFYKVLCEVAQKNQVIYSTHSKKFVNVFAPETIVHFRNPRYLETVVTYQATQSVTYPENIDGFKLQSPDDFAKYMRTLEPNIGNVVFASKVLIVEGPLDLVAYRTVIETQVNIGLRNIAIVAAWGKDTIVTLVQLCKKYRIPYFVVHDWDLSDPHLEVSEAPGPKNKAYAKLDKDAKAQYTKNHRIRAEAGQEHVHQNKRNLEEVLGIPVKDKSAASVFAKVNGKSLAQVVKEFPGLIPQALLRLLEIEEQSSLVSQES